MSFSRRKRVLIGAVLALVLLLSPAAAFATVRPFAAAPPGGPGTGGGTGETWPWGWGIATSQADSTRWQAGDTYEMLTKTPRYIETTDTAGLNSHTFIAWQDKGPLVYAPYLKIAKNGVDMDLSAYIKSPTRGLWPLPSYVSSNGTTFTAGSNAWCIPFCGIPLDPGCLYEGRFLRGLKSNNSMTAVMYTDTTGTPLGYIAMNGMYTYSDEATQYAEHQYDTYRFRNPYTNTWEDFYFRFQTYADLTGYEAALTTATATLEAAGANTGYAPGQILPSVVAAFGSRVTASSEATTTLHKELQTTVEATTTALLAACDLPVNTTDKRGLVIAIEQAQAVRDAASVGTAPGQYAQGDVDDLSAMIAEAIALRDDTSATAAQVRTETFAVKGMLAQFESTVVLDGDADLATLTVDGSSVASFTPGTTTYTVDVPNTTTDVDVAALAVSPDACLAGCGVHRISVGANPIDIVVTAANGTTRTYTVTVNRAADTTAPLLMMLGVPTSWAKRANITLFASDQPSGLKRMGYTLKLGTRIVGTYNEVAGNGTVSLSDFPVSGVYTLTAYAEDWAGNVKQSTCVFDIDVDAPRITLPGYYNYASSVDYALTAADKGGSGVQRIAYTLYRSNGSRVRSCTVYGAVAKVRLTGPARYYIKYTVYDKAGNATAGKTKTLTVYHR